MCSNIPASPAYGVYISQLIRYARASEVNVKNTFTSHIDKKNFFWHFCWNLIFIHFHCLKSDSTHHFFRNVCTKSGSLRFSQFSVVDWFCLFIYLWVLTFPLLGCSEFGFFWHFCWNLIFIHFHSMKIHRL
jgi:hypothetical protein